jgi:methionine-S-sulfoxide reductase
VESVEQHSIRSGGWDETENSNDQEDETEDNCECFNHSDLLLIEEIMLMAGVSESSQDETRRVFHNVRGALVSKIDNMKRSLSLAISCVIFVVSALHFGHAQDSSPGATKTAVFAGGCFWCIQPAFDKAPGVIKTIVGYSGGTEPKPTYELVTSEKTNYRESIEVTYDPSRISYDQLLDIYWRQIDPTQADGQFTDIGPSYRAAIFYSNDAERKVAEASKEKLARSGKFHKPIVTEILPAMKFYPAEDYHQKYYEQNPEHFEAFERGSGRVSFEKKTWGGDSR